MADTVFIDRKLLLRALAHLEVIVPSLDHIGSAPSQWSEEEHDRALAAFVREWSVGPRLAEVRRILSDLVDYDELERLSAGIRTWRATDREPEPWKKTET